LGGAGRADADGGEGVRGGVLDGVGVTGCGVYGGAGEASTMAMLHVGLIAVDVELSTSISGMSAYWDHEGDHGPDVSV
jgi:hypothetical protein